MKKIFIISQILYYSLFAQGNIYPTETSYGGGIGFGNMYMILNQVPGSSVLDSIGFDVDELQTRRLVFYGGEGFAQMIGPWRLGGYAGIGSAQISNVYDIQLYKNEVGGGVGYDPGVDTAYPFNDNLSVKDLKGILRKRGLSVGGYYASSDGSTYLDEAEYKCDWVRVYEEVNDNENSKEQDIKW